LAQSKDVKKAASTITKADVARRIAVIADDRRWRIEPG
jgi:hypothetical protein